MNPRYTELTLTEAAKTVPGRPCNKTLLRWIRNGIWTRRQGRGGQSERVRVHLEARKIGGQWYVSPAALEEFFGRTTPPAQRVEEFRPRRAFQARRQQQRHRRAMAELEAAGIV